MSDLTRRLGILPTAALLCTTSGCAIVGNNYIDYTTGKVDYIDVEPEASAALPGRRIGRSPYTVAGLGLSYLTPDTSGNNNIDLEESEVPGGQVTLGLDLNRHLAIEGHSADLGSAGLSPTGRINYHVNGLSALYYAGRNRGAKGRPGLNMFGRFGAAQLENSAVGDVIFSRSHNVLPIYGAGLEYNSRSGIGVRAEMVYFDADAQYAQLGLMYRLGGSKGREYEVVEVVDESLAVPIASSAPPATPPFASPTPQVAPVAPELPATVSPLTSLLEAQPAVTDANQVTEIKAASQSSMQTPTMVPQATISIDTDFDGVSDDLDQCPDTNIGSTVDRTGCDVFSGIIEGVTFVTASSELTDQAVDALDDIVMQLQDYPDTHLTIKAHTDGQGDPARNQALSEDRARAVADYMARRGFPYSRMSAKAYGERSPIDTNKTAEGRANNRRVEIFATNPE